MQENNEAVSSRCITDAATPRGSETGSTDPLQFFRTQNAPNQSQETSESLPQIVLPFPLTSSSSAGDPAEKAPGTTSLVPADITPPLNFNPHLPDDLNSDFLDSHRLKNWAVENLHIFAHDGSDLDLNDIQAASARMFSRQMDAPLREIRANFADIENISRTFPLGMAASGVRIEDFNMIDSLYNATLKAKSDNVHLFAIGDAQRGVYESKFGGEFRSLFGVLGLGVVLFMPKAPLLMRAAVGAAGAIGFSAIGKLLGEKLGDNYYDQDYNRVRRLMQNIGKLNYFP